MEHVSCLLREIRRGEILVVDDGRGMAVKRVIGLPYDKVEINEGRVKINGCFLVETYLPPGTKTQSARHYFFLGNNEYFLLGDNREDSLDSRDYGPLTRKSIFGSISHCLLAIR